MRAVIDRFEGDWAVLELEDGVLRQLPRDRLPAGAREGAHLTETPSGWALDPEAQAQGMARSRARLDALLRRKGP